METQHRQHPPALHLAALALGKLKPDMATTVQSHLDECDECRRFVADTPHDELASIVKQSRSNSNAAQNTRATNLSGTVVGSPSVPPAPSLNVAAPLVSPDTTPPSTPDSVIHEVGERDIPRDLFAQSKYRIIRILGRGGMGTVYEAEHVRMKRRVAIKTINPELVDRPDALLRFEAEVRAFAALDHANIARAFDAESFGAVHAIVMEFLKGQTLYDFLKSRGRLKQFEACRCIRQALIGLQYAHEKGLVHRDMKPQNLLLTKDTGTVKILDFGLAKVVSENRQSRGMTNSRVTLGTYAYMAPEQAIDAAKADIRADIYSLGCTLYFLIAGVLPFDYDVDVKLLLAHQNETPRPLQLICPEIPESLSDLVARMMAKDPAARPQTPREAADALLPFARADSAKTRAMAPSIAQPATSRGAQHLKFAGIAAALLTIFGFGGWAAGLFSNRAPEGSAVADRVVPEVQPSPGLPNQRATSAPATTEIAELPAPFSSVAFLKHAEYLTSDELADRAPESGGSAKAASYITRQFERFGLKMVENDSWFQEFVLTAPGSSNGRGSARNILAILPGQGELSEQAIIVCTHYDHFQSAEQPSSGADTISDRSDESTSGVSALLLIAESLAAKKASLPESHRAVLFIAFDGKEQGRAGSNYYVQHPLWELEHTAAVVNLGAISQLQRKKFFVNEAEENSMLAECIRDAARQRHLVAETRFGGLQRSDHIAFIEHGIPCMHFFACAGANDRRLAGEKDRLNFDGAATIAWAACQAVRKAIAYPDHIDFEKTDHSFNANVLMNVVQTLGVVPNVSAPAGHYPQILFVVPNSPAAKNGLQSGDQVTAINGLPFDCAEDGPGIFHQLTLDEGVSVSVRRGGEKMEIAIPGSVFAEMSGPRSTRLESGMYDVEFRFQAAPNMKDVYLAGEFNAWQPKDMQMDGPDSNGLFTKHVILKEGTYEYKYVIEGIHWKPDPQNMYRIGANDNCIVWVGTRRK